jgi:hypothetical protein
MRRTILIIGKLVAYLALCFSCVCSQGVSSAQGQEKARKEAVGHDNDEQEIYESSRLMVAEEQFLKEFLAMPPQERVRVWKQGKNIGGYTDWNMRDALYVAGIDTVPYLAEIVRNDTSIDGVRAVEMLCNMDKFVLDSALPLPEAGGVVYVAPLKTGGIFNEHMIVDGRRIGKEGLSAVMWAAEQTEHNDLRFHAREASGLLDEDLRQLPLPEQIRQWRKAAADSKGLLGIASNPDAFTLMRRLGRVLVEQAPESIPPMLELLESDKNAYVREELLIVLHSVDSGRVRLRSIEVGREAIEEIQRALTKGNLKPTYNDREAAKWIWQRWSAEYYQDDFYLHNSSQWALIALAFGQFYGEPATKRYSILPSVMLIEAQPEMRKFITYLTNVDPYFPSWEYCLTAGRTQVLHPLFKNKIERYYQHWKRFKSEQSSAVK